MPLSFATLFWGISQVNPLLKKGGNNDEQKGFFKTKRLFSRVG
jgi:hypothetical protein